jgi:hypothetical protein
MTVGIGLSFITSPGSWSIFAAFGCLAALYVSMSYRALTRVNLNILNSQYSSILMRHYFEFGTCLTTAEVAQRERIVLQPEYMRRPVIHLGASLGESFLQVDEFRRAVAAAATEPYLINARDRCVFVVLHKDVDKDQHNIPILRAFFAASRLRWLMQHAENRQLADHSAAMIKLVADSIEYTREHFANFQLLLRQNNWNLDYVKFSSLGTLRSSWKQQQAPSSSAT